MGGVALLAGRLPVAFQDRLDEGHERRQAGGRAGLWWFSTGTAVVNVSRTRR